MKETETPRPHDHVVFHWETEAGMALRTAFHDPRRFGVIDLFAPGQTHPLLRQIGPEPFEIRETTFHETLRSITAPIKNALLNQKLIAGIGNIYASEALFLARLHPERASHSIGRAESDRLLAALRQVLEAALASGGSTLRDYVRASGETGYFQHHFQVYGKNGTPCPSCSFPLAQSRQAGRSSFYCPSCQK